MGLSLCVASNGHALDDLADLSLEDLLQLEVTSVSKKSQLQRGAPAAIYVITQDDIRRSAATNIPDLLRTVPGLHVAQLDRNKWSISSRGFGGRFANKLLLVIDGRSVYNPNFAGVDWEFRDVLLEDIARIEIIRGPAATLWGANGLNGVINVTTKPAAETQGGLLRLGGGKEERAFGALRYGGRIGQDAHYRAFLQARERASGHFATGGEGNDDWEFYQTGFRFDWDVSPRDRLTLQAEIFYADVGQTTDLAFLTPPRSRRLNNEPRSKGLNALARWTHTFDDESELQIQAFFDRLDENDDFVVDEVLDNYDIEFEYRFQPAENHEILVSAGFHYMHDKIENTQFIQYQPGHRSTKVFQAVVQDQIALFDDRLHLTLAAKVEHNSYSGFEIQPSIRAAWRIDQFQTVWAAISRGVRTPSTAERDVSILDMALPGPLAIVLEGNRDFDSEVLWAYELGYRAALSKTVSIDLAAFYNDYDKLRSIELSRFGRRFTPLPPHWVIAAEARNNAQATTYGGEAVLTWIAKPWWRIEASYSFLEVDVDIRPRSIDILTATTEEDSPEQQFALRNSWDLPNNIEIDAYLRYVDPLPSLGIDNYWNLDLRLGWQPRENVEFALVGHNLLQSAHTEYQSMFVNTVPTQVERGVYGKVTVEF